MSKKVFRIEDYLDKTVMDIRNKTDFEIFRNVLKLNGRVYDAEWENLCIHESPFYMGFDFNSMIWLALPYAELNDYQILNFDEFDWDETLLAYCDSELDKVNAELVANTGRELDLRMEKQKLMGQKELLEAKIETENMLETATNVRKDTALEKEKIFNERGLTSDGDKKDVSDEEEAKKEFEEDEREMLDALRHSDTVRFVLTGIGETVYPAKNIYEYIMELKEAK